MIESEQERESNTLGLPGSNTPATHESLNYPVTRTEKTQVSSCVVAHTVLWGKGKKGSRRLFNAPES